MIADCMHFKHILTCAIVVFAIIFGSLYSLFIATPPLVLTKHDVYLCKTKNCAGDN